MGRASHWASTARWLAERHRAVALDQRGHGRSDKPAGGRVHPRGVRRGRRGRDRTARPRPGRPHRPRHGRAHRLAARRQAPRPGPGADHLRHAGLGARARPRSASGRTGSSAWPRPLRHPRRRTQVVRRGRPLGGAPQPVPRRVLRRGHGRAAPTAGGPSSPGARCSSPARPGSTTRTGRSWPRSGAPPWSSAASTASWAARRPRRWSASCRAGEYAEVADAGHLVHYDQPEGWRAAIEPFLDSSRSASGTTGDAVSPWQCRAGQRRARPCRLSCYPGPVCRPAGLRPAYARSSVPAEA